MFALIGFSSSIHGNPAINASGTIRRKKVLMHPGCQHGGTGKKNLEFLARHGVHHMDGGSPKFIEGVGWDLVDSLEKKEACQKYGISLDAYHLPLTSAGIDRAPGRTSRWPSRQWRSPRCERAGLGRSLPRGSSPTKRRPHWLPCVSPLSPQAPSTCQRDRLRAFWPCGPLRVSRRRGRGTTHRHPRVG